MNVNDDFSQRVVLHSDEIAWEDSPMPGVQRRRLDRVQGDIERVTTIVRYAPNSEFSAHVHGGGEEFIVLEGVFEDDYGDWPVGSYIRNPPGSKHTPGSKPGCMIFVKLGQFDPIDRTFIHANRLKIGSVADANREGVKASPLFQDTHESVCFETWAPQTTIEINTMGGVEIFVLEGSFSLDDNNTLRKHSWLREPLGNSMQIEAGEQGAVVWMKSGHLRQR